MSAEILRYKKFDFTGLFISIYKLLKSLNYGLIIKLVFLYFVLNLLSKHKALIIILLFEMLDITKIFLRKTYPYIPIDFVFVFGITASYYFSPFIALLIFSLGVLNRILLFCIEERHLTKAVRHVFFYFFISILPFGFFTSASIVLTLNYVLKYGFNIARSRMYSFDKTSFHIANYIGSTLIFYLIFVVCSYFPGLFT